MLNSLKVNSEYAALVPRHSIEDYKMLEASIVANGGAFEFIKINGKGEILDGHTRYEICSKYGLEFKTEVVALPTFLDEKIYVIEANLQRRHLNTFQNIELNLTLEPLLKEKAKQQQGKRTDLTSVQNCTNVEPFKPIDTLKILAKKSKSSRRNVAKVKKILEKAPEKIIEEARCGKRSINSAYTIVKEQERQEKNNEALAETSGKLPDMVTLYQGDFKEVSAKLQENSIDFIITDPPYGEQFLHLYEKLGEVASRLLKPGGSLLVMSGQSYLPDVFDLLRSHLTYNWTIAYLTPGGQSAQLWERKVNTFWKPVLWFVKGKYEGGWVGDVAKSAPNDNEKQFMGWQQSESGIADLVERFTKPNDLILDPFMGSGTTGVLASRLGRRFIGIDIDAKMVEIAKQRMSITN